MSVHSVNSEGLQRLQSLINGSHWLNKKDQGENNNEDEKKSNSNSSTGGNSFSYSLEKYMDPNRPFKCDVCKESFTQKNILLVHYNSVSHLHRLKKTMQEQQNQSNSASTSTPEKNSKSSALEALLGNIRGDKKSTGEEDEVKPYKCNICKVAYTQGSTLDIHIRSVLHQTKAAKLQELILTGQLDMTKPLIEQPEPSSGGQSDPKKMIADILLSPNSLNSTGSSNPQTSPNLRSSSPDGPQSSPLVAGSSAEQDTSSDLMKSILSKLTSTPKSSDRESSDNPGSSPDFKNLLQNYGLDLVKQFNELKRKNAEDSTGEESDAKRAKESFNGGEESPSRAATPASVGSNADNKEKPQQHHLQQQQQAPNLAEMQEALQRAMMGAQLQQMNPMMMQMAQLQGLNPLIAMNLYPPLIPPNLLKPPTSTATGAGPANDLLAQLQSNPLFQAGMDPKLLALMSAAKEQQQQQQAQQQQQPPKNLAQMMSLLGQAPPVPPMSQASPGFPGAPGPAFQIPGHRDGAPGGLILPQQPVMQDQGKRARTRISDDQLKILRANFDINNSPTEETLNKMSAQTGLPLKVIKHWFRNTLFKERQKNKDSPYNFNNPPSTKLNLEEYEKTGEAKVAPLGPSDQEEYIKQEAAKKELSSVVDSKKDFKPSPGGPNGNVESAHNANSKVPTITTTSVSSAIDRSVNETLNSSLPISECSSTSPTSFPQFSRLLGPHLTPGALGGPGGQPPPLLPNFPAFPLTTSSMSTTPPMPEYLTTLARQSPMPKSPQSVGSGQGKRANRTRFTDYQIKVLQEFFENNAYPKDDDLEYLSKLLGLSPRVIVVWFQNARQKARKIYENQPPNEVEGGRNATDEASGRFTSTSGCN
jgi:AT-binding transcription factor 1